VVTYDDFKKTLDLKAPNQAIKNRWIEAINHVVSHSKQQNKAENLDWTKDDA